MVQYGNTPHDCYLDVGLFGQNAQEAFLGEIVHLIIEGTIWVENVVRQFGFYLQIHPFN